MISVKPTFKQGIIKYWLNGKNRGLKSQKKYDTIKVKKGQFIDVCKKTLKYAQNVNQKTQKKLGKETIFKDTNVMIAIRNFNYQEELQDQKNLFLKSTFINVKL